MNFEYPIEQLARSPVTQFQMGFARLTMYLMPEFEDVALEPSPQGLKILGASEIALTIPGEIIRKIHADDVVLRAPRVRMIRDTEVREPVMWVRASTMHKYAELVVHDLIRRGAVMEEVDWTQPQPIVRARAPLRNLLGYPQALATLSQNTADLMMWLSHYAALPPDPCNDAA